MLDALRDCRGGRPSGTCRRGPRCGRGVDARWRRRWPTRRTCASSCRAWYWDDDVIECLLDGVRRPRGPAGTVPPGARHAPPLATAFATRPSGGRRRLRDDCAARWIAVIPFTSGGSGEDSSAGRRPDRRHHRRPRAIPLPLRRRRALGAAGEAHDRRRAADRQRAGRRYLLDGSIRRAGGTLRDRARFVDAESGAQLWSETYNREIGGRNRAGGAGRCHRPRRGDGRRRARRAVSLDEPGVIERPIDELEPDGAAAPLLGLPPAACPRRARAPARSRSSGSSNGSRRWRRLGGAGESLLPRARVRLQRAARPLAARAPGGRTGRSSSMRSISTAGKCSRSRISSRAIATGSCMPSNE